jgi:hypothetical protein
VWLWCTKHREICGYRDKVKHARHKTWKPWRTPNDLTPQASAWEPLFMVTWIYPFNTRAELCLHHLASTFQLPSPWAGNSSVETIFSSSPVVQLCVAGRLQILVLIQPRLLACSFWRIRIRGVDLWRLPHLVAARSPPYRIRFAFPSAKLGRPYSHVANPSSN